MMLKFHDIEQNDDLWYSMRGGKVTSSKLSVVMANEGKAFGDPAKRYAKEIATEQLTGKPVSGGYNNSHMDRGHEDEPAARALYEKEMFCEVLNGGFYCDDKKGCSPDGRVMENGLIEIKSAIVNVHYDRVRKSSYDSGYKWQLYGNMYFTGREWIDFVSYCSEYPEGKKLYVKRLYAKDYQDEFKRIDARLSEFFELIEQSKEVIEQAMYVCV